MESILLYTNIEDVLEQKADGMITFAEYMSDIGNGFEAVNSTGNIRFIDPNVRLELATIIASEQPNKIGVLKTANELLNEKGFAEDEVAKFIRTVDVEHQDSKKNSEKKYNSKFAKIPLQRSGKRPKYHLNHLKNINK